MAVKLDELKKLVKLTDLIILRVEDDSSATTPVKVLTLQNEVLAIGSIPLGNGDTPKLKGKTVHVAADNIDEMMKDCEWEKQGDVDVLHYKGEMHLDIGKPKTRTNPQTNETTIIQGARIWLTKAKFSKNGGDLRNKAADGRAKVLTAFFGAGKIAEVGTEDLGTTKGAADITDANEPEPVVVGEKKE